jgi:flavin-dependent dehydrogenase
MHELFDVIVVGAGPAGLMAAIQCAYQGLNTIVLERKNTPASITRTCAQAFFTPVPGFDHSPRFYQEKVRLLTKHSGLHQFIFETLDFSLDYHGPIMPMRRFVYLSPSGHRLNRYPPEDNRTWCMVFNKEDLINSMLDQALEVGVTVISGVTVTGATDTGSAVEVQVSSIHGNTVYQARRLVAADGASSKVVETLGWNKSRKKLIPLFKALSYIVDGVEPDIDAALESGVFYSVPSINKAGLSSIGLYPEVGVNGRWQVVFSGNDGWRDLIKSPRYMEWFRKAKIVRRTAVSTPCYSPLPNPGNGNVIAIGDSSALFETLVSGAIACGYQSAGAIVDEFKGKPGNASYNRWWNEAFAFNSPNYTAAPASLPILQLLTDDEMDSLFLSLQGKVGVPGELALTHLEERLFSPIVYAKLKPFAERMTKAA